jgi:hypothetical protein
MARPCPRQGSLTSAMSHTHRGKVAPVAACAGVSVWVSVAGFSLPHGCAPRRSAKLTSLFTAAFEPCEADSVDRQRQPGQG